MTREVLIAIRQSALAQVAMCDSLLRAMESGPAPAPPGECAHPPDARVSTARMGAPGAFACRGCGAEIE